MTRFERPGLGALGDPAEDRSNGHRPAGSSSGTGCSLVLAAACVVLAFTSWLSFTVWAITGGAR